MTNNNYPKAMIYITSYRGISPDAMHFYGKFVRMYDFEQVELKRPLTDEEIKKYPDRFYLYEKGDMVNAFNAWLDVILAGAKEAEANGIDLKDVFVEGIPNVERLNYLDAIKPLDTRLKCKGCGKVITKGEGVYNTPNGVFCVKCYK